MQKQILKIFLLGIFLTLPNFVSAATWYVRTDGGTGYDATDHPTGQCSGLVDAPYPGSGINQPCAVKDHYQLIGGTTLSRHWNISGGDTVLIAPGNYLIGWKNEAEQKKWCSGPYNYGCWSRTIPGPPSGTAENHTKILGVGWDTGCANPPVLKGDNSEKHVFSIDQSSNLDLQCLEITDSSNCKANAHDASNACPTTPGSAPYFGGESYAWDGIYGGGMDNVLIKDVNIHGLGYNGVNIAGFSNLIMENVRIWANGFSGINAAINPTGDLRDYNHGNIVMRNVDISYNGCAENPITHEINHCHAEYGDGVGTSATCGDWLIEDSKFNHNTSDGLDLLYLNPTGGGAGYAAGFANGADLCAQLGWSASATIRRSEAIGNAGNAFKVSGSSLIENSIADASCLYFYNNPMYPFPDASTYYCRAYGQAIVTAPRNRKSAVIRNNYIGGNGDTMVIASCTAGQAKDDCGPGTTITIKNNTIYPSGMWKKITGEGSDVQQGFFWADAMYQADGSFPFVYDFDYNIILPTYLKPQAINLGGLGSHTIQQNPLFATDPRGVLGLNPTDYTLQATSPARGAALFSAAPTDDFVKSVRRDPTDMGPLAYGSVYKSFFGVIDSSAPAAPSGLRVD